MRGLMPYKVKTLEQQKASFLDRLRAVEDPVEKGLMLNDLHDRNETLYHRVILDEVEEIAPLVYTPTVGKICQDFSHNFVRPRGLYFTPEDRGDMSVLMQSWPMREVNVVVATDGGRVLGLGDLGANGMGISIGKLAIYCAVGGIAPHRVLPVALDVGTNNEALLNDPEYRGWPHKRLEGEEYYTLVDEFVQALFKRYPRALLQFEDFSSHVAAPLLDKYRNKVLCFNDDIQGTGAVCVAGVLGALKIQQKPAEAIKELKIVLVGAGSAGIGVAGALRSAMVQAGASEAEAARNFYVLDKEGLVGKARGDTLGSDVMEFARDDLPDKLTLEEVVAQAQPGMILGLSGVKGAITPKAVELMVTPSQPRPIVFPLSNPTSNAEISPEEVYRITNGGGIVATGSPFGPVQLGGATLTPSQCNNMYIFPGLGLGNSVCLARTIPEPMIYKAALAISEVTSKEDVAAGRVFPGLKSLRECALKVSEACVEHALETGIARVRPEPDESVREFIERKMYYPEYVPLMSTP